MKSSLTASSISSTPTAAPSLTANPGYRAAEAYIRPSPIFTAGKVISSGFDLRNCTFTFKLEASAPTSQDAPTEIFLPEFHFPGGRTNVEVSGGKHQIANWDEDGGLTQKLKWWHGEGEQWIKIQGVKTKLSKAVAEESGEIEAGYGEMFGAYGFRCNLM